MIYYDNGFDSPDGDMVFLIAPNVFKDDRGSFSEVLKEYVIQEKSDKVHILASSTSWIKLINRSVSKGGTIRGCHALCGKFCLGKLVEALTVRLYDIIIDARPDSKTFGLSKVFILDPEELNKLWVPRGFLHSFIVPLNADNAVFLYFCDNIYDKESEIGINPLTALPPLIELLKQDKMNSDMYKALFDVFDSKPAISDKDANAKDYVTWMLSIYDEYNNNKTLWYK